MFHVTKSVFNPYKNVYTYPYKNVNEILIIVRIDFKINWSVFKKILETILQKLPMHNSL